MDPMAAQTLPVGGPTFLGPWTHGTASWTLWGPARSETVQASQVDLMVFRMTGELPLAASPVEGFPNSNNYLIKTATQWVFAVRNL